MLTERSAACARCGLGRAHALFPQLDGSPVITGCVYFFPVGDDLNDKPVWFCVLTAGTGLSAQRCFSHASFPIDICNPVGVKNINKYINTQCPSAAWNGDT